MAAMNICLVVKRCSRKPVIGMTTAIVSMNAVESHCAARASMWRSSISFGMATVMIVSLRITTNVAASSSQITRWSRGAMRGAAAAGPGRAPASTEGTGEVFSVTGQT